MERGHDIRSTPTSLHADDTSKPDPKKPPTQEQPDNKKLRTPLENAIDRIGADHPFHFPGIPGVCSAAWTIETAIIIHEALVQDASVEEKPKDIESLTKSLRKLAGEVAEYELSGKNPDNDEDVKNFVKELADMQSQTDNGSSTGAPMMTTGVPLPNGDSLLNSLGLTAWGLTEITLVIANGGLTATATVPRAIIVFAIKNMRKLLDVEDRIRLYDGAHRADHVVLFLALFCMFFEVGTGVALAAALTGRDELKKFAQYMIDNKSRGETFFNPKRLRLPPYMQPPSGRSWNLADYAKIRDDLIRE